MNLNKMRSKLLITSAAALLAGTVLAFGQGAPERKDQARPGTSQPGVTQEQPKGAPGAQEQPKAKGAQGAQKEEQRPSTSGQAPGASQPGVTQGQPAQPKAKGAQKEEPRPSTSGQAPGAQGQNPREQAQPRTPGQNQPGANQPAQTQPGRNQPGQTQGQNQPSGGGSVTFTTEQRTKIRTTVLEGRSAPRVERVDFSLNVGTVVPRTVRVVEVPETIIEIHPEWRGYRYFVYKDEIIIVEPRTLAIVAVIEV